MCKLCMQFSQNRNFQTSKQARKSELRKCKYIEKRGIQSPAGRLFTGM